MEYYFKITQEEYLQTLEALLRDRRKSIFNIIIFFVMTVGQLGFVIWHIASSGIDPAMAVVLLVCSLAICALQLFHQLGLRTRAKSQMMRDMNKGNISEEFWKQQHLTLRDDLLSLKCGKSVLKYDCAYFSKAQEVDNMLLLNFRRGKDIHQLMIPLSIFKGEGSAEFVKALEASKKSSLNAGFQENRVERPENCDFSLEYSYSFKDFCRHQVRAARLAYTSRVGWTLSTIARVAAAVYLVWHIASGSFESNGWVVFSVCVIVLLIYPLIIAFTPLCPLIVKRNITSLFGGLDSIDCSLDVCENKLWYIGDSFDNVIDLSKIVDVVKAKDMTVFYFKDNTAITVPFGTSGSHDTLRMAFHLESIADINWRSRSRKEKLR